MSGQLASMETFQVVTFSLMDSQKREEYAIPIEQVREIRAVESITSIPKTKSFVKGVMNLRGSIVPVIDVKEKLGLRSDKITSSKQRILVAEFKENQMGLLVDEVNEVMRLRAKDIDEGPQPMSEYQYYLNGIAKVNENLIVLLDVQKLVEDSADIVNKIQGDKK